MDQPAYQMNKLDRVFLFLGGLSFLASVVFAGVVFWPTEAAYEIRNPDKHHVTYEGGVIKTYREFCIHSSTPITIDRDLIQVLPVGSTPTRMILPQTSQVYNQGCQTISRVFEVPDGTPPGNYVFKARASWYVWGFRRESVDLPLLNLAITKK